MANGEKRKSFGNAEKLNFRTCRLCLKHWRHYNKTESLKYPAVMFEELKEVGNTPMHSWIATMNLCLIAGEKRLEKLEGLDTQSARRGIQVETKLIIY